MKPHKDIFDYALTAAKADVSSSIMIGDAIDIDILGAINAGWDTAYYNPGKITHERRPTYEVTHLQELMEIF
jgi:putative hydrolase of the HAD superfamily